MTTQRPAFASLLCALCLTAPAAACELNVSDLGTDSGSDTDGDEDRDDNNDEANDDDEDGDDDGIDVLDSDDDGADDGSGDGADDESDDGADGNADAADDGDDDGFGDDDGNDDGFGDDGPGDGSACGEYCTVELACDDFYDSAEACVSDCQAVAVEVGMCVDAWDGLNTCLGELDCESFAVYWDALAMLDTGQDPGPFPCAEPLETALVCFDGAAQG